VTNIILGRQRDVEELAGSTLPCPVQDYSAEMRKLSAFCDRHFAAETSLHTVAKTSRLGYYDKSTGSQLEEAWRQATLMFGDAVAPKARSLASRIGGRVGFVDSAREKNKRAQWLRFTVLL